jgi:replicative DNA helicase
VSIEPDGVEETYDLTVDGLHSFVADDIVVHNSLEQDSDLVAFIYRDEYYNDESPDQGLAEVILAKHRNGPTGLVKLSFLQRYAKFADLAAA